LLIWDASPTVLAVAVMSLLLLWRHGGNMRKLLRGTESKIGQKPATAAAPAAQHTGRPRGRNTARDPSAAKGRH
jgi:glycerol-3-phosphate acyltransferase PlsY